MSYEIAPGGLAVVLAHPDDESVGCAGAVAVAHAAGATTRLLVATRGEAGTPDGAETAKPTPAVTAAAPAAEPTHATAGESAGTAAEAGAAAGGGESGREASRPGRITAAHRPGSRLPADTHAARPPAPDESMARGGIGARSAARTALADPGSEPGRPERRGVGEPRLRRAAERPEEDGTGRTPLALAALVSAALGAALARALAALRLRGRSSTQAEPVAKRGDVRAAEPLHGPKAGDEARPPFVAVDDESGPVESGRELPRVAHAHVRLVPRQDEIPCLQPLDRMSRVRRVDGERAARDEDAGDLIEHALEGRVFQVLDEVGRDRLVERAVRKRKRRDVGELEPEAREDARGRADRARLRVDADDLAPERREEMGDGAARTAEVEHSVTRIRLDEIPHRRKAKPRPRRLLQVRARHGAHERVVVPRRRAADEPKPHEALARKSA